MGRRPTSWLNLGYSATGASISLSISSETNPTCAVNSPLFFPWENRPARGSLWRFFLSATATANCLLPLLPTAYCLLATLATGYWLLATPSPVRGASTEAEGKQSSLPQRMLAGSLLLQKYELVACLQKSKATTAQHSGDDAEKSAQSVRWDWRRLRNHPEAGKQQSGISQNHNKSWEHHRSHSDIGSHRMAKGFSQGKMDESVVGNYAQAKRAEIHVEESLPRERLKSAFQNRLSVATAPSSWTGLEREASP